MGKRCQQKKGLFDLNKKRLFVFACLMFFSFTVVGAAVNVSNSPTTSSVSPRVAVDSLGYVHVIWVELSSSSTGDLYYSRGNRDATQWTVPINLSQSNKVYCPSLMMAGIDVDACNRVYVVYVDGNQVKLRILADGVWGSAIVLDDRPGVDAPRVAVSPGPITVWNNSGGELSSFKFNNFLSFLNSIDTEFQYYGRAGAVEFITQDADHRIQVMARIYNGNCSKTVPGLIPCDENTAAGSRRLIIPYLVNNASYRSSCGFFNPTSNPITVEFRLINNSGNIIGSLFTKSFSAYDFKAFNPFKEAGIPYPAYSYDGVILLVRPVSGSGKVICFGASANNTSNDPAAHIALRY
jgi:hypothetical protein